MNRRTIIPAATLLALLLPAAALLLFGCKKESPAPAPDPNPPTKPAEPPKPEKPDEPADEPDKPDEPADQVVSVTGISLDNSSKELGVGESFTLTATVKPDNATDKGITWSSDNPGAATVSGGKVTGVAPGAAVITATTNDGGFTASCTVTVVQKVTGVSLDRKSLELRKGETFRLTASVTPKDATNKAVEWKSSAASVASVSKEGLVTAVSKGKATITVTTKEGGFSATCAVTVTQETPPESVSLDRAEALLKVGETLTLTATVLPRDADDKSVTWSTSDEKVATVDAEGIVTAKSTGTAVITVTTTMGSLTAECKIIVQKKPSDKIPGEEL